MPVGWYSPWLVMGAAFSGSRMAVVLTRDGNSDIYVGSSDGSSLRRVTTDPGADISPAWSPDGSKIAFVSDRAGGPQVYVMDAGGGGQFRAVDHPGKIGHRGHTVLHRPGGGDADARDDSPGLIEIVAQHLGDVLPARLVVGVRKAADRIDPDLRALGQRDAGVGAADVG